MSFLVSQGDVCLGCATRHLQAGVRRRAGRAAGRVAVAVLVMAGGVASPAAGQTPAYGALRQWRAAVAEHQPGERDEAVEGVAAWAAGALDRVLDDLEDVERQLHRARRDGLDASDVLRQSEVSLHVADVGQLLDLGPPERRRFLAGSESDAEALVEAAIGRLLARGALLHLDIVLLVPPEALPSRRVGGEADRRTVDALDGQILGVAAVRDTHRAFAERLIERLTAATSSQELESLWYRATTAELLVRRQYGYALPLLERARDRLRDDARLLFYRGVLHEVFASPRIQGARLAMRAAGQTTDVRPRDRELDQARRFLEDSLAADPAQADARVHLGRVLGLRGRPDDGRGHLEAALASITDPWLRYYAELFLGDQHRALGSTDAARAAYERARELFPRAQTPRLALSLLGHLSGRGIETADAATLALITQARERTAGDDPWWYYEVQYALEARALLDQLRSALVEHGGA